MAASEHAKPESRREDALAVVQALQAAGHIAYFAGGCVRDMLWQLTPKDFDVATDAPPTRVRELFSRSQGVGQAFGVVLVRQGRSQIEVATFRAEGSYSDGRRPDEIRFATPQEDAQRRDFTINGVFFDPVADRVIDFVQGQADIESRTLRAIGDPSKRFAEDYLRLLRAVRFTSRFDLTLDESTAAAIRANASKLPRIAPERIGDELRAAFATGKPSRVAALLDALALTPILLRGLPVRPAAPGERHMLASLDGDAPSFALALTTLATESMLLANDSIAAVSAASREIADRLRALFRLSNDDTVEIETTLHALAFVKGEMPGVSQLKRYLARACSTSGFRLLRSLAASRRAVDRAAALETMRSGFPLDTIAPPPLVDGTDLHAAGHKPGPAFKRVLDAVYDAQLEGRITTRDAALRLAESLMIAR